MCEKKCLHLIGCLCYILSLAMYLFLSAELLCRLFVGRVVKCVFVCQHMCMFLCVFLSPILRMCIIIEVVRVSVILIECVFDYS